VRLSGPLRGPRGSIWVLMGLGMLGIGKLLPRAPCCCCCGCDPTGFCCEETPMTFNLSGCIPAVSTVGADGAL